MTLDEKLNEILYDYWARHRYCEDGCKVESKSKITIEAIKQLIEEVQTESYKKGYIDKGIESLVKE
jgi:hypothetical protein